MQENGELLGKISFVPGQKKKRSTTKHSWGKFRIEYRPLKNRFRIIETIVIKDFLNQS